MIRRLAHIARRAGVLIACACMLAAALPASATAAIRPPSIDARAGTLLTIDGDPLWSSNSTAERRVASTIKMLNALVVREHAQLDDRVRVSHGAASVSEGGVGLVEGQRVTVRQLLQMMLVASANDAAVALATYIGGTEKNYVRMMNDKARRLGLRHTEARDPNGLGKLEHSSASDLSTIGRTLLADRQLRKIVAMRSVKVPTSSGRYETYGSTNHLLGHYKGIEGVKTGFTNPAGFCFVGAAKRGDVELVGVVLGTDSLTARFGEMAQLLDWGFKHTRARTVVDKGATYGLSVGSSRVTVHPEVSVTRALFDGGPKVTNQVCPARGLKLPIAAGQEVGTITAVRGGRTIASTHLVSLVGVAAPAKPTTPTAPTTPGAGGSAGADIFHTVLAAVGLGR